MYSQQQRPRHYHHHQQQQHSYPMIDNANYAATNPNIPYLQQPQQQLNGSNNNINMSNMYNVSQPNIAPPPIHLSSYQQQQHGYIAVPPEPVPSATDTQTTPPLSIPQLADFASTMVFLMWHARRASVMALHDVSKIQQSHTDDQDPGHSRETANIANCKSGSFKKFCEQILIATQLSESVILLSLKYIAMLLQNNPNIQGADGSEYRLFTVALMLANKFLDDNTFTNKTWSEVSGMKVTDLNIMELEFLDVLRFKLFIRFDEYERWKMALLQFKNQLLNANQAQKQEQLFEETFKRIVSPTVQHQQHQQYHNHYLLMLSKAQQPQYQPPSRPLTRVPLRIPHQPVRRNAQSVQAPIYDPPPPSSTYVGTSTTASQAVPTQSSSDYYPQQPAYNSYAQQQQGVIASNDHPPYYQAGYNTSTSFIPPSYSQQSMVNSASCRLSGISLSSPNSNTPNSSYFYLTPPNKPATTPDYYPQQQRHSYYDIPKECDDTFGRPTSGYQQQLRPQYTEPQKKYSGPTLEDPLTAAASYRKK
ncbi:hypothetical protein K501DRAFT_261031 [Backusella circina FSU 941]|nr:hypothetical protein K501DRAFT_261031 [Backusella circina FSU 941]